MLQARLIAMNGPLRKSAFPVAGELSLGRDLQNTVRLEDPWVSARHCIITDEHGRCVLQDLDSHAGTFVNGIPVKLRELKAGDELAIGNSIFVFETDGPVVSPATKYEWTKTRNRTRRWWNCILWS